MNLLKYLLSATYVVLLGSILQMALVSAVYAEKFFTIKNGQLERPTGFREWIYVGTPVTPNDMNGGKAAFPNFTTSILIRGVGHIGRKLVAFVKAPF